MFGAEKMSDDRAAFLAAIREAPEDDTSRLVFADWLEEHGDDQRAEFIRAQVTASRLDDLDPECIRLERRAAVLLKKNEKRWLTPVRRIAQSCMMERGFPRHVVVNSKKLRAKGAELFALEPIWSLRPTSVRSDADHVTELMDGLAGVRELAFENMSGISSTLRIKEWDKIFTHPTLASVHSLALSNNSTPIASWKTLFESEHLRNVRRLTISQDISSATRHLVAPCKPPILESLREVHFTIYTGLKHDNLATWAERLPWPQITDLTVSRRALGTAPPFPTTHLKSLRAAGTGYDDEDSGGFLGQTWPALEQLELTRETPLSILQALEGPRRFPRLRTLTFAFQRPRDLIRNQTAADVIRSWARSPLVGQLEELTIGWEETTYYEFTSRANRESPFPAILLDALLARPEPLRLRKLVLRHAALAAGTLTALMSSAILPDLRGLALERCDFPENWMKVVAKTTLPNLKGIGLGRHDQTDPEPLVERFGEDGVRWDV
jgi:uncharacterized protein (TIGR02996 family)